MVGSRTLGKRVLGIYLPLAFFILFLLFPFYWMSLVSLKSTNDLFELKYNPFWIQTFTLENYLYLFQNTDFPEWVKNTIIVSVVSTVAVSRKQFSGRGDLPRLLGSPDPAFSTALPGDR